MNRDIQLKVQLNAEEFVAFRHICDEEGQSQSGKARALIKQCIHAYAESSASAAPAATDETGQE
jgi:hypothetical protein